MKVGIITWWRNNYGSILQALALQQKLNQYWQKHAREFFGKLHSKDCV